MATIGHVWNESFGDKPPQAGIAQIQPFTFGTANGCGQTDKITVVFHRLFPPSVHQEIINTEPYDSVFGSRHNYTAISVRNNYGLDNIGDPTSYVKSSDVKLKEIDANGNKIGSSLSVN